MQRQLKNKSFFKLFRCLVYENIKALWFEELRFGHNLFILPIYFDALRIYLFLFLNQLELHNSLRGTSLLLSLNHLELQNTTRGTSLRTQVLNQSFAAEVRKSCIFVTRSFFYFSFSLTDLDHKKQNM